MSEIKDSKTSTPKLGGRNMGIPAEKAKNTKNTLKNLFIYMKDYKIGLFLVLFFSIGGTIFGIVGPKMLGNATTEIFPNEFWPEISLKKLLGL